MGHRLIFLGSFSLLGFFLLNRLGRTGCTLFLLRMGFARALWLLVITGFRRGSGGRLLYRFYV